MGLPGGETGASGRTVSQFVSACSAAVTHIAMHFLAAPVLETADTAISLHDRNFALAEAAVAVGDLFDGIRVGIEDHGHIIPL